MTTDERLGALAMLIGVVAAFAFCIWILIKLGTWIVVQFYGDRLGIEQQRVFAKPQAKAPDEDQPVDAASRGEDDQG